MSPITSLFSCSDDEKMDYVMTEPSEDVEIYTPEDFEVAAQRETDDSADRDKEFGFISEAKVIIDSE